MAGIFSWCWSEHFLSSGHAFFNFHLKKPFLQVFCQKCTTNWMDFFNDVGLNTFYPAVVHFFVSSFKETVPGWRLGRCDESQSADLGQCGWHGNRGWIPVWASGTGCHLPGVWRHGLVSHRADFRRRKEGVWGIVRRWKRLHDCDHCDGALALPVTGTHRGPESPGRRQRMGKYFQNIVVFRCQCVVLNPRVLYTHAQEWSRMHVKDPVVHVRVWWITETRKDPACPLLTGGWMYFCTVNGNSRVTICTLLIAWLIDCFKFKSSKPH